MTRRRSGRGWPGWLQTFTCKSLLDMGLETSSPAGCHRSVREMRVPVQLSRNTSSLSEQIEETDVYQDLCWEHLSDDYVCSRPLVGKQTTYTECCCLYGEAWGMQCALCPMKDSGEPSARSSSAAGLWDPAALRSFGADGYFTCLSSPSPPTPHFTGGVCEGGTSRLYVRPEPHSVSPENEK